MRIVLALALLFAPVLALADPPSDPLTSFSTAKKKASISTIASPCTATATTATRPAPPVASSNRQLAAIWCGRTQREADALSGNT